MDILVTYVTVNARGQTQREQRRLAGTVLTVGRGTQCEIHLPDPRVALVHARLTLSESGAAIAAEPGRLSVNGREVEGAELAAGDRVELGPYTLEVEAPPEGVRFALSIRLTSGINRTGAGARRRLRLNAPPLSIRRLSYLAFFGVLGLFLVLPIAPNWVPPPAHKLMERNDRVQPITEVVHALGATFTQTWNPGPLSQSHQVFGKNCAACHAMPLIPVRDVECLACHQSIREHVPRAVLAAAKGPQPATMRCAECHRDHQGLPMVSHAEDQCAACHRDIRHVFPDAQSKNVTDFRFDHPEFRLSVPDAGAPHGFRRVRQHAAAGGRITERSNLKFDHRLHLDPRGVRQPRAGEDRKKGTGPRTVLVCASCHEVERDGERMKPVSMERNCQRCHSLAFEPATSAREVPHGSEMRVLTMLREFYARLVLGDTPPGVHPPRGLKRMRPGEVSSYEDRQRALEIADRKANQVMRDLFEKRQVCSTCHYVSRGGKAGWQVAPLVVSWQWMPGARFSHAKHAAQGCATCHDVVNSSKAEDVAMPDIAKCRECHVGAKPVYSRVASDCSSCHRYHSGPGLWHTAEQPRLVERLPK